MVFFQNCMQGKMKNQMLKGAAKTYFGKISENIESPLGDELFTSRKASYNMILILNTIRGDNKQ